MKNGNGWQEILFAGLGPARTAFVLMLGATSACTPRQAPPPASLPAPAAEAGTFLLLSDLHFDPFADPALVPRLAATDAGGWHALLAASASASAPGTLSGAGHDTNYALLESALDAARRAVPKPDFLVVPGDFLAHRFEQRYAKATGDKTSAGVLAFATKTIQFLALELAARFPDPPIFPALGNNDSADTDYGVEPSGPFLAAAAKAFEPLANRRSAAPDFATSFAAGGHYTARLPVERLTTLVVIDSVVWSARHPQSCGSAAADPGSAELAWLTGALDAARSAGSSVWLEAHIPPGFDVPTMAMKPPAKSLTCPPDVASFVSFYANACTPAFLGLLQANAGSIALSLGGHTHADDFRLFPGGAGAPPIPHKIALSVSPVFGNAPGFLAMSFDRRTGAIRDYTATVLGNPTQAGSTAPGEWRTEYSFDAAYQQTGFSSASVSAVAGAIATAGPAQGVYTGHYNGGGTGNAIAPRAARAFACGIQSFTAASFSACLCPP